MTKKVEQREYLGRARQHNDIQIPVVNILRQFLFDYIYIYIEYNII